MIDTKRIIRNLERLIENRDKGMSIDAIRDAYKVIDRQIAAFFAEIRGRMAPPDYFRIVELLTEIATRRTLVA